MCGRFSFSYTEKIIEEIFEVEVDTEKYKPRYNCTPSQNLAVISNEDPKELSFYKWGLIPFWAKDIRIGNSLINAKAETILEKSSFRQSFRNRRCLVPADSFYEWKQDEEKTPYRVLLQNEEPFAMAGIWDKWKDAEGKEIHSFSIITTEANKLMKEIHSRMPVILPRSEYKNWLEISDTDILVSLLKPYDPKKMEAYPVSKMVNSPRNDSPELHRRIKD
jgi:putative SOS response-associated peptidase YedK